MLHVNEPDIPNERAAGTTEANPSAYEKSTFWSPAQDTSVYPGERPKPVKKYIAILVVDNSRLIDVSDSHENRF